MLNPLKPLNNNRGVALLIAMFAMTLMVFIAVEVSYDTQVEYIVASQSVNRLKAHYAAKAGAELSLLRVLLYKKAVAAFGDQLKENVSMLDPIWNFPLAWPPSEFLPEKMSSVDRDLVKSAEKESLMNARYFTTIESEGSKIDINDLASSSESLAKSTRQQILQIFQSQLEIDDDFREDYDDFDFEKLVNNMVDWVDSDSTSLNGGDENTYYQDQQSEFIPPNQPFKTLQEIHMVQDMTDQLYDLLAKRVTVYGVKGINVNYANDYVLQSLDPEITDEVLKEIKNRRTNPEAGGPFKSQDDFTAFLESQGVDTEDFNRADLPLYFDSAEHNFRIESTGQFANVSQKITLITYDLDSVRERMIAIMDEDYEKKTGSGQDQSGGQTEGQSGGQTSSGQGTPGSGSSSGSGTQAGQPTTQKKTMPTGRPRVVYWFEK